MGAFECAGRAALAALMSFGAYACAVVVPSAFAPAVSRVEGMQHRTASESDVPNGTVDHFAVLIGANTELRHQGNLSMAYQVLVEQGYRRENIYILDPQPESTYFPATDYTTREAVTMLFAHMRRIVESQDTLLVYVTGHGRRIESEHVSTLVLSKSEELRDVEFAALLEGLHPNVGIAFFDQCYGGAFIGENPSFIYITVAADNRTSYGVGFPRAFWAAFRTNGAHSVGDAFSYACANDRGTALGFNHPVVVEQHVSAHSVDLRGVRTREEN